MWRVSADREIGGGIGEVETQKYPARRGEEEGQHGEETMKKQVTEGKKNPKSTIIFMDMDFFVYFTSILPKLGGFSSTWGQAEALSKR